MIWDKKLSTDGQFFETRKGDPRAYELTKYGSAAGRKTLRCVAQLPFPKFNDGAEVTIGDDFFTNYQVKHGVLINKNAMADN